VDTLIVDREPHGIGDNCASVLIHALTLQQQVQGSKSPALACTFRSAKWPTYIHKDKLSNWFEAYSRRWSGNFGPRPNSRAALDETEALERDAAPRRRRRRVMPSTPCPVLATGVSGIPNVPEIPGLRKFFRQGRDSSRGGGEYTNGENLKGQARDPPSATGNSGRQIAQDLYFQRAEVTLKWSGSPTLIAASTSAQLRLMRPDTTARSRQDDLIATRCPLKLARRATHGDENRRSSYKELLEGLVARRLQAAISARQYRPGSSNIRTRARLLISTSAAPT